MEYPELEGICATAIKNNLCTGCQKLEDINFRGVKECKYVKNPREQIKEILGIQEMIKL
jgi:hypothetical protein